MISLLIPGYALTKCGPLTEKAIIVDITDNAREIHTIGIFLNEKLPDDVGIGLFYSIFPYKNLLYLGAISNEFPRYCFT